MNNKGVVTIIVVFFLIICSVSVGLGAYLLSQQIKKSPTSPQSAGQVEESIPPTELAPLMVSEDQLVSLQPEADQSLITSPGSESLSINFTQSGTILDWDAQTESHTGIWRFLWDEPGALALTAELEFNPQSQCDLGSGNQVCQPTSLINGTTVQIEGEKEGNKLIVVRLKAI